MESRLVLAHAALEGLADGWLIHHLQVRHPLTRSAVKRREASQLSGFRWALISRCPQR
jgi:hypothetical protein